MAKRMVDKPVWYDGINNVFKDVDGKPIGNGINYRNINAQFSFEQGITVVSKVCRRIGETTVASIYLKNESGETIPANTKIGSTDRFTTVYGLKFPVLIGWNVAVMSISTTGEITLGTSISNNDYITINIAYNA